MTQSEFSGERENTLSCNFGWENRPVGKRCVSGVNDAPDAVPVSQSVISRSRPALTPPPAPRSPAPPLPVEHKYRVLAPGGYSIVASEVSLSQRTGCSLPLYDLIV